MGSLFSSRSHYHEDTEPKVISRQDVETIMKSVSDEDIIQLQEFHDQASSSRTITITRQGDNNNTTTIINYKDLVAKTVMEIIDEGKKQELVKLRLQDSFTPEKEEKFWKCFYDGIAEDLEPNILNSNDIISSLSLSLS